MNVGPTELLIIVVILAVLIVPITVGVIFLARNKGLDDSHGGQAYPPGWQPPPGVAPPPPSPTGPATWSPDTEPPPQPPPSAGA